MATTDLCAPVRNDVQIAFGESHIFNLLFEASRPLNNAKVTFTIKRNNSDTAEVYRDQQPIVDKGAYFKLLPSQCRQIGEGRYWYDIWLIDGDDFEKPIVMGELKIPYLTTRSQA